VTQAAFAELVERHRRELQPYPDRLLEPVAPAGAEPDTAVVAKETIELAFLGPHLRARGARVFLAGRTREPLETVAADIAAAGGTADVAVVDALDEQAIEAHAQRVASEAGSVDVSFNLITRGDLQGVPLVDMKTEEFAGAVSNGLVSSFLTARAAARQMIVQGSGAILYLTSGSARDAMPLMGNTGPADAAVETFMRHLAAEIGPHRVLGLYTAGVLETLVPEKLAAVNRTMKGLDAAAIEQMVGGLAQMTMLRRAPRRRRSPRWRRSWRRTVPAR
jgi:NAD(P)-dependent dehydrogenase (short-subunit alcohol dehydrogenase family)